jgi:phosphoenolpyruvate carboxykinase (ATP)
LLLFMLNWCSYGTGNRIKLNYTRKIIDAIHNGSLLNAEYKKIEIFGLETPTEVDGVPSEILDPVNAVSYPIVDQNTINKTQFDHSLGLLKNL